MENEKSRIKKEYSLKLLKIIMLRSRTEQSLERLLRLERERKLYLADLNGLLKPPEKFLKKRLNGRARR